MTGEVRYKGNLRCECIHTQSGSIMETDAPTDNRGKGERFSPTDSVCMALATCMITTMAIKASDREIQFDGSTVEFTKHMLSNPRRIGKIEVVLKLTTTPEINSAEKEYLKDIADNCPVMKSIHPSIDVSATYNWNN